MLISKGEVITTIITALTLKIYSINPVYALGSIVLIKVVKLAIDYQCKKNPILSFLRLTKQHLRNWRLPLINLMVLGGLSYKFDLPLWYGFYPLSIIEYYTYMYSKLCKIEELQVIDDINGVIRIYSKNVLPDKSFIELKINSTVDKILQDIKRKNIWYVHHSKGRVDDYRKMNKGSLERLAQVLRDLKANPRYDSSFENEVEVNHCFTLTINIKMLERQLKNIEHKTGYRKNSLSLETDKGMVNFSVKKDVGKIYLLDDIIPKIKLSDKMVLPFVAGCNIKSGTPVVHDLVELNHVLIAGKSKMGKSSTFKSIIESLMYFNQNTAFYMIDFGESALTRYSAFNNVKYVESDIDSIACCIQSLTNEMVKRRKLFRTQGVEKLSESSSNLPYLILTVDEANGFKTILDIKKEDPLTKAISTLYFQGRKYGIYIIMAVQQTSDTYFVKPWKTQCTRIIHYLADPVDVSNASANTELQKIIPNLSTGEFILDCEGEYEKMKGALTDNEHNELHQIIKKAYTTSSGQRTDIAPVDKTIANC